jgi:hypothetical protein
LGSATRRVAIEAAAADTTAEILADTTAEILLSADVRVPIS